MDTRIPTRQVFLAALFLPLLGLAWAVPARGEAPPELSLRVDATRKTLWLEMGPVSLAANVAYQDAALALGGAGVFPLDAWLYRFEVVITDASGRRVSERVLHHLAAFAPGDRDLVSPIMGRIVAFGTETQAVALPRPLGYRVHAGDSVLVAAALFNPTARPLDSLYVRVRIDYATTDSRARHTAVLPLYLDAHDEPGGGARAFDVPPGRWETSAEWSPAVPGRLLAAGAHLHKHGVAIILEDVTARKILWRATPTCDRDGEIVGMPIKLFRGGDGVRLDPGHVYRLTAIYQNPTGEVIRGAMGKMGGVFRPDRRAPVPAADRAHPEYLRDREAQTTREHRHRH